MVLRKQRIRPEVLFDPQPDDRCETVTFEVRDSAPNPEELYVLHQCQLKTLRAIRRLRPHLSEPIGSGLRPTPPAASAKEELNVDSS